LDEARGRGAHAIDMPAVVVLAVAVAIMFWKWGPRRPSEPGFKYVHVNQDGSVRELSPEEQTYLSTTFQGGDSGRPYVKSSYESRDGWGSRSGYLSRNRVPRRLTIDAVHPNYDAAVKELGEDILDSHRAAGDVIERNADGSVACRPNPAISRRERFERVRSHMLAQQRRREALAKT
jgi:hypothetical protein